MRGDQLARQWQLIQRLARSRGGCGLDELADDTPEEHWRLVQAAVRYFVSTEDADADLESLIGFDDDGDVIEAVALAVGLGHVLEIEPS